MKRMFTLGVILLVLTACMSMPFKAMYKMARLDPLTIEPAELQLALRTNQVVEVASGSVTMQLEFSSPAHKGLPSVERKHLFDVKVRRFNVEQTSVAEQLPDVLLDGLKADEQVTLLYLSDEDAKAMAETQAIIKKYKQADAKGKGMLGFGFNQNCLLNTEQMVSLPVDLFLKTAKDEAFFMFFDDLDVIEQAKQSDFDLTQVNQCTESL